MSGELACIAFCVFSGGMDLYEDDTYGTLISSYVNETRYATYAAGDNGSRDLSVYFMHTAPSDSEWALTLTEEMVLAESFDTHPEIGYTSQLAAPGIELSISGYITDNLWLYIGGAQVWYTTDFNELAPSPQLRTIAYIDPWGITLSTTFTLEQGRLQSNWLDISMSF